MPKLVWTRDYELGIDVIDKQHQRIVHYINSLYDATEQQANREQLKDVLNNLVDYTLSHFAFEESLMEESNYPDLQGHQLTHQNFTHLIEDLKRRFNEGDSVAEELAELLQNWLINHIMNDDVAYVNLVKQNLLGMPEEKQQGWIQSKVQRYFELY